MGQMKSMQALPSPHPSHHSLVIPLSSSTLSVLLLSSSSPDGVLSTRPVPSCDGATRTTKGVSEVLRMFECEYNLLPRLVPSLLPLPDSAAAPSDATHVRKAQCVYSGIFHIIIMSHALSFRSLACYCDSRGHESCHATQTWFPRRPPRKTGAG